MWWEVLQILYINPERSKCESSVVLALLARCIEFRSKPSPLWPLNANSETLSAYFSIFVLCRGPRTRSHHQDDLYVCPRVLSHKFKNFSLWNTCSKSWLQLQIKTWLPVMKLFERCLQWSKNPPTMLLWSKIASQPDVKDLDTIWFKESGSSSRVQGFASSQNTIEWHIRDRNRTANPDMALSSEYRKCTLCPCSLNETTSQPVSQPASQPFS